MTASELATTLATTLACSLVPPLVASASGAAVGRGPGRMPGADMLVGIGLAGGLLTILAVITRVPLSDLMLGVGAMALLAPLLRRQLPGGVTMWIALALALPLLLRAAASEATLWDEFWQWLPNAAYAFTHNTLAGPGLPPPTARFPGYPQTIPFAMAGASFLAGRFLEAAGPVLNVALLAAYAALLADAVVLARGRKGIATPPLAAWALTAGIVAAVLVVDPGLDGTVLLSSYADAGTMVLVGALGLLGVELLARLAGRSAADPIEIAWRFGFVAAALLNLKQGNPVLLALIMAALGVIVLCDPDLRPRRALALLPQLLGPAVVLYLVWRWYVLKDFPAGEVEFRPFSSWNFSAMPACLAAMLRVASQTPLFHIGIWLVTVVGLAAIPTLRRRAGEAAWLAVITAIVWLGYNAFLLLVYLAVFSNDEARWAADYWRYTPHVALLGLSAPLVCLARIRVSRPIPAGAAALLCAGLALSAPFVRRDFGTTAKRWPLFVRGVDAELKTLLPPGSRVIVALAYNIDPFPIIVHYDLWQLGDRARTIHTTTIWYGADLSEAKDLAVHGDAQYLILTDQKAWSIDTVALKLGVTPPKNELVLFAWRNGQWTTMKSWPIPPAVR